MIRRAFGTILCFLYGFTVPLAAVAAFALWREDRQRLGRIEDTALRLAREWGLPAEIELNVLAPAAAIAAFIVIWILAGKRTRRATWMIVGFNSFAVVLVALVVFGQK